MHPARLRRSPRSRSTSFRAFALILGALALGGTMSPRAGAQTLEETSAAIAPALKQALQTQRADYRRHQFERMARNTDRDSLIAAVLLGMPAAAERQPLAGQADAVERLARTAGEDPLALFALTLACQLQQEPCAHPETYDALRRVEPGNAVAVLMLPNGAGPSGAQLHEAAAATGADTHWRDIVRVVRAALAGQAATAVPAGVDPQELALLLRRDAVEQIQLPNFAAAMRMCKGAAEPLRTDCLELGRRLENDASGTFLSRMIGSSMVRRLVKGTPEEASAKELRRIYTWLSEQLAASTVAYAERLQEDGVAFGEWEAWERAAERLGIARTPPPGWLPKDPQALLLSEERAPAPAR